MISACTGADAEACPGIGYVAVARRVSLEAPGKMFRLIGAVRVELDRWNMDGLQASASDDVRSAKAEKQQQLLRMDGAAQRRELQGGESWRISGASIDKGRRECGLKDGLLVGDGVVVYGQGFGCAN